MRALRHADEIRRVGASALDVSGVPVVKLTALARYGMTAKVPALREPSATRRAATLLATGVSWGRRRSTMRSISSTP